MSLLSNWGMRKVMDTASQFYQAGMPVYLRVRVQQTVEQEQLAQFGFQVAASGQLVTQDVQIVPQPQVQEVNMRDIGLNAAQLSFGARQFFISHTFVLQQQLVNEYYEPQTNKPDFYRVFRDQTVVGLYYNSRLFKMVSITHEDLAQAPWMWHIVGQAVEQPPVQ